MTHQPTLTTIVPAYNAERFLERALRSALGQGRPPDEIVVVDDGSSDGTAAVAESLGPPVRCVRQGNQGASAARNRGLAEARGEVVAFLDADDEWRPGHLERALSILSRHPDLVWCCAAFEVRPLHGPALEVRPDESRLRDGAWFESYFDMAGGFDNHMTTMVIRRAVVAEAGGFDPELRIGEDLDLWYRIGLRHPRIGYSREIASSYVRIAGSLMDRGHDTVAFLLAFLRRGERQAAELGPEALRAARPVLRWRAEKLIRQAARIQERGPVREVLGDYGEELPRRWRWTGRACLLTPGPLWRPLMRLWDRLRLPREARRPGPEV